MDAKASQLTASHDFDDVDDSVLLFARCFESSQQKLLEFAVQLRLEPADDVQELWRQLEGRLFKA